MAIWKDFSNNIPATASKFAKKQNRCKTKFGKGCSTIWNRFKAFMKGDDDVYQALDDRHHRKSAEEILQYLTRNGQMTNDIAEGITDALKSVYFNRQTPDLSIFEETAAKYPQYYTELVSLHNNIVG